MTGDPLADTQNELAQLIYVAGQIGVFLAQRRAVGFEYARREDMFTQRAMAEQVQAEIKAGSAFYSDVEHAQWWEAADGRDVATAYGFAQRFAEVDPRAATARTTIEREVCDRWGVTLPETMELTGKEYDPSLIAAPILARDASTVEGFQHLVKEAYSAVVANSTTPTQTTLLAHESATVPRAEDEQLLLTEEERQRLGWDPIKAGKQTREAHPQREDENVRQWRDRTRDITRAKERAVKLALLAGDPDPLSAQNTFDMEASPVPTTTSEAVATAEGKPASEQIADSPLSDNAVLREAERELRQSKAQEAKEAKEAKEALNKAEVLSPETVEKEVDEATEASWKVDTLQARRDWVQAHTAQGANADAVRAVSAAAKMRARPISGATLRAARKGGLSPASSAPRKMEQISQGRALARG